MKFFGLILAAILVGVAGFFIFSYLTRDTEIVSPVPDGSGVRVIYVTPGDEGN